MEPTSRKTKAIRSGRVCYNCAYPILDGATVCPRCGGSDIDDRRSRPGRFEPRSHLELPHPWSRLKMRKGGTVLLSGGPGSGKSTICMSARPTVIASSEQENEEVAAIWYRVHEDLPAPVITNCTSWEELGEDLMALQEGEIGLVDSISQLASGPHTASILRKAIKDIRERGAMAIFVTQYTKDGEMLGPNELRHMVDVVASIPDDPFGLRRLSVTKNRFGALFTQYFSLGENGVKEQSFNHAYSVEGPPGRYSLHLYPMSGAKWSGIFSALERAQIKISRAASAAVVSPIYETGFVEPDDVEWRRRFAEDHGLGWIDPTKAFEMLADSEKDGEEN